MFKVRVHLAVYVLILMLVPALSFSQQSGMQAELYFIQSKALRFTGYLKDFLDFQKSSLGDIDEYANASKLCGLANEVHAYLDSARTLLYIWITLSCKPDRERVRMFIVAHMRRYAQSIDISIKSMDHTLLSTRIPAMASSGTQMKEDLREIKTLFASIQLR